VLELRFAGNVALGEAAATAAAGCAMGKGRWKRNAAVKIDAQAAERAKLYTKKPKPAKLAKTVAAWKGDARGSCYTYLSGKLSDCVTHDKLSPEMLAQYRASCEGAPDPKGAKSPRRTRWADGEACTRKGALGSCTHPMMPGTNAVRTWYEEYERSRKSNLAKVRSRLRKDTCQGLMKGVWQAL
jgi:hypothetical protein